MPLPFLAETNPCPPITFPNFFPFFFSLNFGARGLIPQAGREEQDVPPALVPGMGWGEALELSWSCL